MLKKMAVFAAIIFLSPAAAVLAGNDEFLDFPGAEYPFTLQASAGSKLGEGVVETPLSAAPDEAFNILLINGMTPAGLTLELLVKSPTRPEEFESAMLVDSKRFKSGRFWAKYKLERRALHQIKLRGTNLGSGARLVIYGVAPVQPAEPEWIYKSAPPTAYIPPAEPINYPFKITLRADWNASKPERAFTADLHKMVTLHHTAGTYPGSYQEAVEEIGFIQDYHQNGVDNDIAYHFLISPQGDIFEGRPLGTVGAHSSKKNKGNVGISVMGNYQKASASRPLTPEALAAIAAIGKFLQDSYAISVSSFYGHRDINQTLCPGELLYAQMPEIKKLISTPAPAIIESPRPICSEIDFLPPPEGINFP